MAQATIKINKAKKEMVITIPMNDPKKLPLSKSEKSQIVATTSGNQAASGDKVNGETVTIGINAYIPNPKK